MIVNKFIIEYDDYVGDFDLKLTMDSGQTSQPPWTYIDEHYFEVLSINDENVLVKVRQDSLNNPIKVTYYSNNDVHEKLVKDKLYYIFDLDYNIAKVYDYLENNEELADVYDFNKGLRLFKAQYPFESIISSICSANNSIKRWTKSINDIKMECGFKHDFFSKTYYSFPDEEMFLQIPEDKLKTYGVGYRSSYMLNSTKHILFEDNYHEKIFNMDYKDAYDEIIQLEGVGPKVADCILLYAYNKHEAYPVDVWINRITTYLYFKGQKPTNKKIMDFAQDKFGEYSGYVQLYLFNYARLSGLMDKLKVKK